MDKYGALVAVWAARKLLLVSSLSSYVHLSNLHIELGTKVAVTGAQLVQLAFQGMSLPLMGPWDGRQ